MVLQTALRELAKMLCDDAAEVLRENSEDRLVHRTRWRTPLPYDDLDIFVRHNEWIEIRQLASDGPTTKSARTSRNQQSGSLLLRTLHDLINVDRIVVVGGTEVVLILVDEEVGVRNSIRRLALRRSRFVVARIVASLEES